MATHVVSDETPLWKVVRRYGLSPREEDVLLLLLQGVHMKEVAAALGCSYSTVRTHVQRAARKLDCSGTPQLLARIARDAAPAAQSPRVELTAAAAHRYIERPQEPHP